ncbi:deferrochelatase/peroxidase EfeB, partial [Streptomyces triticirhizae]
MSHLTDSTDRTATEGAEAAEGTGARAVSRRRLLGTATATGVAGLAAGAA